LKDNPPFDWCAHPWAIVGVIIGILFCLWLAKKSTEEFTGDEAGDGGLLVSVLILLSLLIYAVITGLKCLITG